MSKPCTLLSPALLALAVLVSAGAASARAQGLESKPGEASQTEVRATVARDAQAGGAQGQQPTPTPGLPAPLTGEQKMKRAFRGAFLNPVPYATAAFNAGITQIGEDRLPHKDGGDEVADWGSRTARVFATGTTYRIFGNGIYPTLFRQDPRYERSRKKGVGGRALHAVSRLFVTRDDDGNLEPNYSRFAGAMTSSAMANIWEHSTPGHDRIGTRATFKRFGNTFVSGAIGNLFREFFRR
ncbi:MAG TPA: hypothetical protein VF588_03290 [Pyrinomonadaceae bacterium]|jgi:hypothetical protein